MALKFQQVQPITYDLSTGQFSGDPSQIALFQPKIASPAVPAYKAEVDAAFAAKHAPEKISKAINQSDIEDKPGALGYLNSITKGINEAGIGFTKGLANTPARAIGTPLLSATEAVTGKKNLSFETPFGKVESFGTQVDRNLVSNKATGSETLGSTISAFALPTVGIIGDWILTGQISKGLGKKLLSTHPAILETPIENVETFQKAIEKPGTKLADVRKSLGLEKQYEKVDDVPIQLADGPTRYDLANNKILVDKNAHVLEVRRGIASEAQHAYQAKVGIEKGLPLTGQKGILKEGASELEGYKQFLRDFPNPHGYKKEEIDQLVRAMSESHIKDGTLNENSVKNIVDHLYQYGKTIGKEAQSSLPTGAQNTISAFNKSTNQEAVSRLGETTFDLGSYGKNNLIRKVAQTDRVPKTELKNTIDSIVSVYKAGNDPFRSDNLVWVSKMPDGQLRAIVTRLNQSGNEEIINLFKVGKDQKSFVENLIKFGVPDQSRTGNLGLEAPRFVRLAYEDINKIANKHDNVNGLTPGAKKAVVTGSVIIGATATALLAPLYHAKTQNDKYEAIKDIIERDRKSTRLNSSH